MTTHALTITKRLTTARRRKMDKDAIRVIHCMEYLILSAIFIKRAWRALWGEAPMMKCGEEQPTFYVVDSGGDDGNSDNTVH
jgi:hypothetical protein